VAAKNPSIKCPLATQNQDEFEPQRAKNGDCAKRGIFLNLA